MKNMRFLSAGLFAGLFALTMAFTMLPRSAQDKRSETNEANEEPDERTRLDGELVESYRKSSLEYYKLTDPVRPELYEFAYALTGHPFDANDLTHATLQRAHLRTGEWHFDQPQIRTWLIRECCNVWLDGLHRAGLSLETPAKVKATEESVEAAMRDKTHLLPVMERIAVVLCDLHGIDEKTSASMVGLTVESFGNCLHSGRKAASKLGDESKLRPSRRHGNSTELLTHVCELCNKRDWKKLTALHHANAEMDVIGILGSYGDTGAGVVMKATFEEPGFREARVVSYRGEDIIVMLYGKPGAKEADWVLADIIRVWGGPEELQRLRFYYFSPHTIKVVAEELGYSPDSNGYRY